MKKIKLMIDNKEVTGLPKQTILQVAKENEIEIPTLCYDERMEVFGSCGLCVVEIEGNPKLFKACATEISEGMVIKTTTERVFEARKTNLELLLSKHIGDCVGPCELACPGSTDCQGYVGLIANGEFQAALELIKEHIPLPGCIGRVCPHPCETACRRGDVDEPIAIMELKRVAADYDMMDTMFMPEIAKPTGKSIGIIGGGPAGLSAAYFLAQFGHAITIYDAMPKMGGMLRYGIPEYRLPKAVVDEEINLIEAMGVSYKNNCRIGKDIAFETMRKEHDVVFIALGAWVSSGLRCEGVDAKGVIGGIDFLRAITNNEPVKIGEKVAIVGGGNTAMDACRTAVRLGAKEVYNIYRRTKAEMPAEAIEITEAEDEGVVFKNLSNPIEIIKDDDGQVIKMRLQKMELGEPDASGRRRPIAIAGEEETIAVDTVILAIGQGINPNGFDALELTKWNTVLTDENTLRTNLDGVFAAGDCINDGASIAIKAIGDAKKAVPFINEYLKGNHVDYHKPYFVIRDDVDQDYLEKFKKNKRPSLAHLDSEFRKNNFLEVSQGYTLEQAQEEGKRCMECGCQAYFDCKLIDYGRQYHVDPDRLKGVNPEVEIQDDHPFVIRDNNKCITCGLCVRVCEELIGVSALGLVDRGFDTYVEPALKQPLEKTGCVSCGQCIDVCPTGALRGNIQGVKQVPYQFRESDSTCGYCSAGCQVTVKSIGNSIIEAVPQDKIKSSNEGIMCGRGRFGTHFVQLGDRLTMPLIRNNQGVLEEAEWYDAFVYITKKIQGVAARHGQDSVKMAISPKYTNEEILSFTKLAKALHTETFSFSNVIHGEDEVLTKNCNSLGFDALKKADAILVVGVLAEDNPIFKYKLMQAQKNGSEIYVLNPVKNGYHHFAEEIVLENDDLDFIAEMIRYIMKYYPEKADNQALRDSVKHIKATGKAEVIAELLINRENIVVALGDRFINTKEAGETVANLLALLINPNTSNTGILRIPLKNNSKGLNLLGVTNTKAVMTNAKALLNFGEDTKTNLDSLEFLMVQDTHLTETCKHADVVLPAFNFTEVNGSFVNASNLLLKVNQSAQAPIEFNNIEIATAMAEIMAVDIGSTDPDDKLKEIKESFPDFKNSDFNQMLNRISIVKKCETTFTAYHDGILFNEVENTDYLMNKIQKQLSEVINPQ